MIISEALETLINKFRASAESQKAFMAALWQLFLFSLGCKVDCAENSAQDLTVRMAELQWRLDM